MTYTDEDVREAMQLAEMLYPAAPPKGKKALSVLEWAASEYLKLKPEIERLENEIENLKDAYQRANDRASF